MSFFSLGLLAEYRYTIIMEHWMLSLFKDHPRDYMCRVCLKIPTHGFISSFLPQNISFWDQRLKNHRHALHVVLSNSPSSMSSCVALLPNSTPNTSMFCSFSKSDLWRPTQICFRTVTVSGSALSLLLPKRDT